jgi:hypothetical protein
MSADKNDCSVAFNFHGPRYSRFAAPLPVLSSDVGLFISHSFAPAALAPFKTHLDPGRRRFQPANGVSDRSVLMQIAFRRGGPATSS